MSGAASEFHYRMDVTAYLTGDDIQGFCPDTDAEPASSWDDDYQVHGRAATYLDLYQGRHVPNIHQVLSATAAPFPLPSSPFALYGTMLLSPSQTSPVEAAFGGYVNMADVSPSSSINGPPIEYISPQRLSEALPVAPATLCPEAGIAASSPKPPEKNTTRGVKRPRSPTDSPTGDHAPKRMRPSRKCRPDPDDAAASLGQVVDTLAIAGLRTENCKSVRSSPGPDHSDGNATLLVSASGDGADTNMTRRDNILVSPHPSSGRRQSSGKRRKSARHEDDEEYLPPWVAKRTSNRKRPPPRKKQGPATESRKEKQPSCAKSEMVECPVPKCGVPCCRASDLERHLRTVKQPDHLDVQLFCTHAVHGDSPDKNSRGDSLTRHMRQGRCLGETGLRELLEKAERDGKLAKDEKHFASREYGKWVLHCRSDPRYALLEVFRIINDMNKLEETLAKEAEIIFRCQCCQAARPNWAEDHMDNFGCWEWDEDSQALRRKNIYIQ